MEAFEDGKGGFEGLLKFLSEEEMRKIKKVKQNFLDSITFFKDMPYPYVEKIMGMGEERFFKKDEWIFKAEEPAKEFYIIKEGNIALQISSSCENKKGLTIQKLERGDLLGWSWIIPPYKWNFDAIALVDSKLLHFPAEKVKNTIEEDPLLGYYIVLHLSYILSDRLKNTRLKLSDWIFWSEIQM